jgi:hypothetical protein
MMIIIDDVCISKIRIAFAEVVAPPSQLALEPTVIILDDVSMQISHEDLATSANPASSPNIFSTATAIPDLLIESSLASCFSAASTENATSHSREVSLSSPSSEQEADRNNLPLDVLGQDPVSKRRKLNGQSTKIVPARSIKVHSGTRFAIWSGKSAFVSDRKGTLRSAVRSKTSSSKVRSNFGRKSSTTRLAACSILPALSSLIKSAPVKNSASARPAHVCTAIRTKTKSRSVAASELAAFFARKTCVVCSQPEGQTEADAREARNTHTATKQDQKKIMWLCCSFCDDTFHLTCLPKNFDSESDDEWICPVCSVDSDLKRRSLAARPRLGTLDSTRPSRTFSSTWLKSCPRVVSSSSSGRDSAYDADNILFQPPQLMVAGPCRSYVQVSSLLTGLSVSVILKAALKLPRFADRSESQRADARRKLALAVKEKTMTFDDNLSYPWPDCPQVCLNSKFEISRFVLASKLLACSTRRNQIIFVCFLQNRTLIATECKRAPRTRAKHDSFRQTQYLDFFCCKTIHAKWRIW